MALPARLQKRYGPSRAGGTGAVGLGLAMYRMGQLGTAPSKLINQANDSCSEFPDYELKLIHSLHSPREANLPLQNSRTLKEGSSILEAKTMPAFTPSI